ncbi:hypothetical protein CCP3SC1AL1_700010 [Gammaproteobacteria bacterium]
MQNLSSLEILLLFTFVVLLVAILFVVGMCLRHGCLNRLSRSEDPNEEVPIPARFQRFAPNRTVAPRKESPLPKVWVDNTCSTESHRDQITKF